MCAGEARAPLAAARPAVPPTVIAQARAGVVVQIAADAEQEPAADEEPAEVATASTRLSAT